MSQMIGGKKGKKNIESQVASQSQPPPQAPPRASAPARMPLKVSKVPESMSPDKVVNLEDIPALFRTIERMLRELRDLNSEICLRIDSGEEVWLVPVYTDEDRNEIKFEDAAKLVVVCAAFGGKITSMNFLDRQAMLKRKQQAEEREALTKEVLGEVSGEE